MSWRARKDLPPSSLTSSVSCARGSPSRLVRSTALVTVMIGAGARSGARVQLRGAEEVGDLAGGGVGRIRAVHDVLLDARREVCTDRSGGGFLRIGGAHDLAILRDGVLPFQYLNEDGAGGHVAHQILEERSLAVHRVESL